MRRNPWRGIYVEIAKEEGVTRQAIQQAAEVHRNPRICARVLEKIEERRALLERYRQARRGGGDS